jgi:L-histidine N-alpha-methyltransferase
MSATYQVLEHKDFNELGKLHQDFSTDVLIGLSQMPKRLSSRYFYDAKGSRLFQNIMDLPEYYLTSCEFEILHAKKKQIARFLAGEPFHLIELGAGDGRKTRTLLEFFQTKDFKFQYIPIDISLSAMKILIRFLNEQFPSLEARGLVADYFQGLKWLNSVENKKNFVLFLGSNIGNFDKAHARAFLHNLWHSLNNGDYVLIGFDLKKDIQTMRKAYDDSTGVTAQFNLNLLRRINRELGGNFDLKKFRFYSSYDVFSGAMESYLVSLQKQEVFIEQIGQSFFFEAWEPIHTEYSYKYLESDIVGLAAETGFAIEEQLYDSRKYFVDSIWRVKKLDSSTMKDKKND